jgi:hypothetical protein
MMTWPVARSTAMTDQVAKHRGDVERTLTRDRASRFTMGSTCYCNCGPRAEIVRRSGVVLRYRALSDLLALLLVASPGGRGEPIQASIAELHRHVGETAPPPEPKPDARPPEIVSVVPPPGRRDLGENTVFEIRFSADMDDQTFESNLWLRLGDIGREPTSFVPAKIAYDRDTRTLTLSPLEPLPRLKQVTLTFYRGIAGADGQPLRVVQRAASSIRSRRSAVQEGADLRELLVLTFVTRGY